MKNNLKVISWNINSIRIRLEQLKKITEAEDKNVPTTSDITYTYGLSLLLVAVVVTSAILYS